MDNTIKQYVNKFSEENCIQGKDEAEEFEHFINHHVVRREFSDDFDFNDIHTGGRGDYSIDGLAILQGNALINSYDNNEIEDKLRYNETFKFVFIQSKTSEKFSEGDFLKFLEGINEFFAEEKLNNKNFDDTKRISNLLLKENLDIELHVFFVYNGIKSQLNIEKYKKNAKINLIIFLVIIFHLIFTIAMI